MTEYSQRIQYRSNQILIQTDRVLASQFRSQTVTLTGQELEILRNLMTYAHDPRTFVSDYGSYYYVTPSEEDWDDIEEIGDGLEGKLMGNDNTIFGVNNVIAVAQFRNVVPGNDLVTIGPVPEDEVWVLQTLMYRTVAQASTLNAAHVKTSGGTAVLFDLDILPVAGTFRVYDGNPIVIMSGGRVTVTFYLTYQGDQLQVDATGYKMKV